MAQKYYDLWETVEMEATKECECAGCGRAIAKGQKKHVVGQKYQRNGVSYHIGCEWSDEKDYDETTTIGSSENTDDHDVEVKYISSWQVFQYCHKYGFKLKSKNSHVATRSSENSESLGSIIPTIYKKGCRVFVDGVEVKSPKEYRKAVQKVQGTVVKSNY